MEANTTQGIPGTREQTPPKLSRIQGKVYGLLAGGGRFSAYDIAARLHLSDPRGHIAELRRKGVTVADEWATSEYGTRYKVYFLPPNSETKIV